MARSRTRHEPQNPFAQGLDLDHLGRGHSNSVRRFNHWQPVRYAATFNRPGLALWCVNICPATRRTFAFNGRRNMRVTQREDDRLSAALADDITPSVIVSNGKDRAFGHEGDALGET